MSLAVAEPSGRRRRESTVLAAVFGVLALATSMAVAAPAASSAPGVPTSTVKAFGDRTAHYCVSYYAPNVALRVRNERTRATASIRTNKRGKGCADVPVVVSCGQVESQTIVAAGVAADGNPGTSSARAAVPGGLPSCHGSSSAAGGGGSGSNVPISGLDAVLLGVAAACCVALAVLAIMLLRRRKAASAG